MITTGIVMVRASMSAAVLGYLEFIKITTDKKANLLQSAENLGIKHKFRLYQDNDAKT